MSRLVAGAHALLLIVPLALGAAEFGSVTDPYTGNWSGTLATNGREKPLHATVIAYRDHHEVTLRSEPDPRKPAIVILQGKAEADHLLLAPATAPNWSQDPAGLGSGAATASERWQGRATVHGITGRLTGSEAGTFTLQRIPFSPSPTLGAQAPAGAVVLFAGTDLAAWQSRQAPDEPIQWLITNSGALEIISHRGDTRTKQDLQTKASFGDYQLHLEFKLVHKPEATGQGRSNSGVIHLGRYETQILDSFGLYGRDNECGGIYRIREPDRNAGYPGGLWQTYDIDFKAPRLDAAGTKTADARMTVRLNGILVHADVAVPRPTAGGKETARGPLVLQDHGNPVQFRNIWLVERNDRP